MKSASKDPYIPLAGALIFLLLGGTAPWSCAVSLVFAVIGISTASSKLQRFLGLIIFAVSATALLLGAIEAGWLF